MPEEVVLVAEHREGDPAHRGGRRRDGDDGDAEEQVEQVQLDELEKLAGQHVEKECQPLLGVVLGDAGAGLGVVSEESHGTPRFLKMEKAPAAGKTAAGSRSACQLKMTCWVSLSKRWILVQSIAILMRSPSLAPLRGGTLATSLVSPLVR